MDMDSVILVEREGFSRTLVVRRSPSISEESDTRDERVEDYVDNCGH